jgi:hypothetical protein
MTTEVDALILRYLQDLEAQLRDLPANRRRELLDEVGEHIAAARAGLDTETEARERFGVLPSRPSTPVLEIVTVVLLVIPLFGSLIGAVLVWLSRRWTTGEKLVGTLGGLSWLLAGLGTTMSTPGGSGPGPMEVVVLAAPVVLPVAAAIYLGIRLRSHTTAVRDELPS